MTDSAQDNLVCPHCIARISQLDHFCPKCGGPITSHASTDPMGQIFSTGRAYRNAMESPRGIVVAGMWLIFGPQIPVLMLGLFTVLSNLIAPGHTYFAKDGAGMTPISGGTATDLFNLILCIGLLVVYIVILGEVTSRYMKLRRMAV